MVTALGESQLSGASPTVPFLEDPSDGQSVSADVLSPGPQPSHLQCRAILPVPLAREERQLRSEHVLRLELRGARVWRARGGCLAALRPDLAKSRCLAPRANNCNYLLRLVFQCFVRRADLGFDMSHIGAAWEAALRCCRVALP